MRSVAFLPLALSVAVFAGPLTWDQLIQSAEKDPRYMAAQKRAEATSSSQGTKLWDKMELRYQLDGFSFAKHDFELRMTPKTFGEGSADRARYEAEKNYEQARFAVERSLLLYDRYERGVRYVLRKKIYEINKQLAQVNADRVEVLHLKSGSATFNPEDLMTALEKSASYKAALLSDSTALRDAELKMKIWVPDFDGVDLDTSFLPTMEELEQNLSGGVEVSENFPQVAMAKGKRDSEVARAKQDVSKGRDYISHIGIGYSLQIESLMEKYKEMKWGDVSGTGDYSPGSTGDSTYMNDFKKETGCQDGLNCHETARFLIPDKDNRKTADKFFVNLAIRLPFFDSNKDSDLRQQVASLDAESDYLDDVREVNQKVARLTEEVLALIGQWKVQKEYAEQVNASGFMEQFARNAGSDPLLLLRAKESALESDMKAVKLEYDIFLQYLALLDYAGGLARQGVVNHLREGLK
ncbi:TolC family protein [Fibrobacter sp. UBA4309]|uniref:TolC family protein n=1 Tax=Fibrobacter sp. UBA4309 TaxID=1946537 RepID=UPI0025BBB10D|nr:TolC family protein [Fibrobacter sp. UBA4309]